MQTNRADVFCYLIAAVLFLAPFGSAGGNVTDIFGKCDVNKAEQQCRENQRCIQTESKEDSYCQCLRDFVELDGKCVRIASTMPVSTTTVQPDHKESSGGSSVATGFLVSTFLIIIGVLGYIGARRHKQLRRFRQYSENRYGNNIVVARDDDDDDDRSIA